MTKPIKVFMHVNDMPGAFELMSEQLTVANESGLLDAADEIFICTNGNIENFAGAKDVMAEFEKVKFVHVSSDYVRYEYPTLDFLKHTCDNAAEDFYVCYFHLKGLTRRDDANVIDWRNYMNYWNLEQWEECVAQLDKGFDLVGTNIIEQPWLHSSGNFWWSHADYIKKLEHLVDPDKHDWGTQSKYIDAILDGGNFRYEHEAWIGSKHPVWHEIHSSPGKQTPGWHFTNPYPRENYAASSTED